MIRSGRQYLQAHKRVLSNKENIDLNGQDSREKNHQKKYMDKLRMIKKVSDASTAQSENKQSQVNAKELQSVYSMQIFSDYSQQIFNELSQNTPYVVNCLSKHSISSFMRAKMVDWMIEVLSSYKMSEESFFRSVSLMDQYLKREDKKLQTKDIHLLGISCMFIAMKYEQIHPLRLQLISQKIARKKFSREQIMKKQSQIIHTLDFNLNFPTVYEIVSFLNYSIIFPQKQEQAEYFNKVLLYFSKLSLFKPEMASIDIKLMGCSIYYSGLKLLKKRVGRMSPELYLMEITRVSGIEGNQIREMSKSFLEMASTFPKEYPMLTNLKKFNSIE